VKPAPLPPLSIESLHEHHDRTSFASGIPELDRYLHTQAGQDAKRSVAAPFVLLGHDKTVIGYYTLSSYGILLADLPSEITKRLPKYPVLPATLLGRLAVSRERQRQKLGQFMLMDALRRSWENTHRIGSIGVVVDAYDDNAEGFYLHHEFIRLPGQTRKLFLAMATIKKLFSEQP
jgi:GNAT superfamily N-acetyltransferase